MRLIGNFIIRFIIVSIGFGFGVLAAGAFIGFGFYNEIIATEPPMQPFEQDLFSFLSIGFGLFSSAVIAAYSFAIAGLMIAIAEISRLKGFVTNLMLGGGLALTLALMHFGEEGVPSDGVLIVSLAAGFVGGLVYWLIAGRRAGDWMGKSKAHEQ